MYIGAFFLVLLVWQFISDRIRIHHLTKGVITLGDKYDDAESRIELLAEQIELMIVTEQQLKMNIIGKEQQIDSLLKTGKMVN